MSDWRERLTAYLAHRLPAAESVELANLRGMPAGASNDTVSLDLRVTIEERAYDVPIVLRPERPDGILAPYDVSRQFRVMRALQATAVPVPSVAWYEPDPAVLGAPFFVMEKVKGRVPVSVPPYAKTGWLADATPAQRRHLWEG
ncbi:MAG TPA: phosphotransferase, partial [Tepidiformaceae bacterium]|nr:phosphotransferase [Tepidiformaceae bacterium]